MGPLKLRDFRLLWLGWVISSTAVWVYQVVSMWLIFELTNSPLMLGLDGLFKAVPFLVTSVYGGALSDRMDRRRLLILSQALLVCFALIPFALSATGSLSVWHLYGMSFVISILGGFDSPARQALVPAIVPAHELMKATALTSSVHRSTALLGPLIGGLGVSLLGAAGTFIIYAALNGVVLLLFFSIGDHPHRTEPTREPITKSILEGFQLVLKQRALWGVLSLGVVHTFLVTSQTLMPVFARHILNVGPTGLGMLYAASGMGSILSSSLAFALGDIRKKGRLLFISDFSKPLALVLFAGSSWMPVSMVLLVYAGIFDMVGQIVRTTILHLIANEATRGRVMAMNMMVQRGLSPLSGLQSGALASLLGAPVAMATGAAVFVCYGIFLFFKVPEVYDYGQR